MDEYYAHTVEKFVHFGEFLLDNNDNNNNNHNEYGVQNYLLPL